MSGRAGPGNGGSRSLRGVLAALAWWERRPQAVVSGRRPHHDRSAAVWQHGSTMLTEEQRAERLGQLTDLIEMVRPIIHQDGGDLVLVSADVEAGVVELQLQGACSSCAISATTLQAGVERILKERLDWIAGISGGVDEDADWEESAAMGRGGYVPKW